MRALVRGGRQIFLILCIFLAFSHSRAINAMCQKPSTASNRSNGSLCREIPLRSVEPAGVEPPRISRDSPFAPLPRRSFRLERAGYITAHHSGNPSRHALRDLLVVIPDTSNAPAFLRESISDGVTLLGEPGRPRLPGRSPQVGRISRSRARVSVAERILAARDSIRFDYRRREESCAPVPNAMPQDRMSGAISSG